MNKVCRPQCPHCQSSKVRDLAKPTALGYRQFRCDACRRQFNERTGTPFNRLQVPTDVALLAVRWYLRYKLSLRDLEELLLERGFEVAYETIRGWVHDFSPLIVVELRRRRSGRGSKKWHLDETYVKLNGKWWYLWRAIDGEGNLVDIHLSEERDRKAADAFLAKAKAAANSIPERTVTDGWKGYKKAIKTVLGKEVKHSSTKGKRRWPYANNRLEQDHRGIKGRLRPMLGLKGKDGSSAERLMTGVEEVRQHFRTREKFAEQVPAGERRRRYMLKLREWEEIVKLVA